MALYTIKLTDIQVYAPIGWYPEEKDFRNHFRVNIEMDVEAGELVEELSSTIDYTLVTRLVMEIFSSKELRLLETVVNAIGQEILRQFQKVEKVTVEVKKNHPLVGGEVAAVAVQRTFFRG